MLTFPMQSMFYEAVVSFEPVAAAEAVLHQYSIAYLIQIKNLMHARLPLTSFPFSRPPAGTDSSTNE